MKGIDMTQGTIWKQLLRFALPLALANLLQQSYNTFDAIIVGRFVSSEALAAVGASIPITMMILAFFMGLSNGASVLIAQFFGAKNKGELKNAVHTAILLAFMVGAVLSVVGILVSPLLLRLVQTPEEVFVEAVVYLRIYFAGLTGLTVYNMSAAILAATGDSKRPLYFLMISVIVKVSLNFLFVLGFGWGVMAVAWSTVISQALTAILAIRLLCHHPLEIRLNLRQLKIHKHILRRIAAIGMPGGIQGAIISFSNIIVQTYINYLGGAAMAGYSVSTRIDSFLFAPVQGLAMASATFVGQNLGAQTPERARSGTRIALLVGIFTTMFLSVFMYMFATSLLRIFTNDEQVIYYGFGFMRVFVPFYFMLAGSFILSGALRGSGDVRVPTLLNILCFVVLRQIYLFVVTGFHHSVTSVALGFPIGWFIAAIAMYLYYRSRDWSAVVKVKPETQEE